MKTLRASDIPAGSEATAYIEIDGKVEEFFYAKSIEANAELNKSEVKVMGKRGVQNKATGWTGSGSMTIYYITTIFRNMLLKYAKEGILPAFKLVITNEDKGTTIGKQTVVLYDCVIDSVNLAKFDVESDALDEDMDFTFSDFDILDSFGNPIYQG
ncbi:MAG: phage tail tube protein [Romboutsia timonensis]